jgi:polyribonucleotide nucleotidyltransferase
MVEGGAAEATEAELIDALDVRAREAQPILELIERMRGASASRSATFTRPEARRSDRQGASRPSSTRPRLGDARLEKKARYDGYSAAQEEDGRDAHRRARRREVRQAVEKLVKNEFEERKAHVVRSYVLDEGKRIDGRDMADHPPDHDRGGSAAARARQRAVPARRDAGRSSPRRSAPRPTSRRSTADGGDVEALLPPLQLPPFSTGETKPMRGPGRREIGHGALAERALAAPDPPADSFPTRSASSPRRSSRTARRRWPRCAAAAWRLMDAGVPIKAPVAGIAMGLIMEGDKYAILSDILGDEDHLGDMDFKVCGTAQGHHRHPDGHQDRGPLARDPRAGARAGPRGPPPHPRQDARDAGRSPRPTSAGGTRRASPPSRSSPTRSASSSAPAARPSRASSTRPASPSTSRTTARSTSPARTRTGAEGPRHHQGPHGRARGRRDLQGHRQAHRRLRRLRRDLPRHRRPAAHLRDRPHARRARRGRRQGGRRPSRSRCSPASRRDGKIRLSRRELLPLPEGEEGERAKERMLASREAGPPRGDRGPRRDGPPRGDRGRGGPPRGR